MSTMYEPIEIEFNKRKPSRAVIMRTLAEYLKQGAKSFDIRWGENWIEIDWHPNQDQWYGRGWIKEISGDSIAIELNEIRKQALAEIAQFKKDHFQFIHIGG
jgi:hypothetical protein